MGSTYVSSAFKVAKTNVKQTQRVQYFFFNRIMHHVRVLVSSNNFRPTAGVLVNPA